jgi:hypothetical protein
MRERVGKRLPSYDELMDAAEGVAEQAEVAGDDEVAIVGGLAMQVWGSPRLTADLDVIAASDLDYEGEPLSFGGVRTREGTEEKPIDLDVIVRDDEWTELYQDALENAIEVTDVPLPVVIPEFLVPMKMVAGRPRDEGDVRYLVLREDFDQKKAEDIVREHLGPYAVRELRAIVEEAKWRKSRGEE